MNWGQCPGHDGLTLSSVFYDGLHGLCDRALNLCCGDATVSRVHFVDRLPGINVPEGSPDDQRLRENPTDGSSLVKGLLGDFLVDAGGNPDVNLAVESSGHRKNLSACTTIPWYITCLLAEQQCCSHDCLLGDSRPRLSGRKQLGELAYSPNCHAERSRQFRETGLPAESEINRKTVTYVMLASVYVPYTSRSASQISPTVA